MDEQLTFLWDLDLGLGNSIIVWMNEWMNWMNLFANTETKHTHTETELRKIQSVDGTSKKAVLPLTL